MPITGAQLAECYRRCYERKFGVPCPWDGGDERAAARTVDRLSGWGPDEFERCFENLFASKDGRSTKKPSFVLTKIHEYVATPLNQFNRPLEWKDLTLKEKLAANQRFFDAAAERREERRRANGGRETGAFHSDEVSDYGAGADVVFDNSPAAKQPDPAPEPPLPDRVEATVIVMDYRTFPSFLVRIRPADADNPVRQWPCADKMQQEILMAAKDAQTPVRITYRTSDGMIEAAVLGDRYSQVLGLVNETCERLSCVTPQNGCSRHESFTGKHREALAELLLDWTPDEVVSAYREFVRCFNDFEMANAPQHFVEGPATDVLRRHRNFKVALEQDKAQEPQRREQRRREQETRNQELERKGREQMRELEEALANPIRTWQPAQEVA